MRGRGRPQGSRLQPGRPPSRLVRCHDHVRSSRCLSDRRNAPSEVRVSAYTPRLRTNREHLSARGPSHEKRPAPYAAIFIRGTRPLMEIRIFATSSAPPDIRGRAPVALTRPRGRSMQENAARTDQQSKCYLHACCRSGGKLRSCFHVEALSWIVQVGMYRTIVLPPDEHAPRNFRGRESRPRCSVPNHPIGGGDV